MIRVAALGLTPVKGTRWQAVDALRLGEHGAAGDRRFLVVREEDHKLLLTTRNARLTAVVASWHDDAGELELAFPDGTTVRDAPRGGVPAETQNYEGRPIPGRLVDSAVLTGALCRHLGRRVRLLERSACALGPDDAPVSLMSTVSLAALAPALDGEVPDARRFRMNVTLDGADAWEEHGWPGAELALGDEAVVRVVDPVPRCAVTTRDPDTGERDVPTLRALAELRGKRDVTFGVWLEVVRPGTVRVGDVARVLAPAG